MVDEFAPRVARASSASARAFAPSSLSKMKKSALAELCEACDVDARGTVAELRERLRAFAMASDGAM